MPDPAAVEPLDPAALRALLVELQRGAIIQANAARRLLGLPPVMVPDRRDRANSGPGLDRRGVDSVE